MGTNSMWGQPPRLYTDASGNTMLVGVDGSNIANVPAGNIAATDVQAALNELDTEKQAYAAALATLAGITSQQATDLAAVSTFMGTVLNDADAATARATLELVTVSQAEAEAGTATTTRAWTSERVKQAIAALQTSMLTFASTGITAGATEYMGSFSSNASAAKTNLVMPFACTLKNMYVVAETAPGAGQNNTYTLFKNGVGQTLTATMADTATTANDTTNSVTFAAGDTVTVRVVLSGSSASTTTHHVGIEVAP